MFLSSLLTLRLNNTHKKTRLLAGFLLKQLYRLLISVVFRFIGAFDCHSDVFCLILRKIV